MQKKYLIITCMIVLLISGCINLAPKKDVTKVSALYKGTSGLKLSFVKNAPPKRVFEDTMFNVIVKIENKGTYDLYFEKVDYGEVEGIVPVSPYGYFVLTPEIGYVDLKGIEESESVKEHDNKKSAFFEVKGKSLSNPIGDEVIIYSNLKARKLGALSKVHESSVFATVCYPYQTKLSTSVCIDPDIYNLKPGKKACNVKDLVFLSGQGAPVAITKVEVQMVPIGDDKIKPKFLLHIENKGKGEVVKKEKYMAACETKIEKPKETDELYKYFNVINFNKKESKLSDFELVCKQGDKKEMVLSGKKGVITCEAVEKGWIDADRDAYVAPLSIVLDYGYSSTISKGFNIEK